MPARKSAPGSECEQAALVEDRLSESDGSGESATHCRVLARGEKASVGPRAALHANRERVLMLPPIYRPKSIQTLGHLRDDDLAFLVRYHEEQAEAARAELARRVA